MYCHCLKEFEITLIVDERCTLNYPENNYTANESLEHSVGDFGETIFKIYFKKIFV